MHRILKVGALLILSTMFTLTVLAIATGADDNTIFELDGDTVDSTPSPSGDDWATLFANTPFGGGGSSAAAFDTDAVNGSDDILFGGQTKDNTDFSAWGWKQTNTTKPQAKDDIEHAFAAAYHNTAGDLIIYFGADRWDINGSAQIGFWFVQDPTVAAAGNGSNGSWTGHHVNGDLLIISDFQQGGVAPHIVVYEWQGQVRDSDDNITVVGGPVVIAGGTSGQTALCTGSSGAEECAITNSGGTPPWDYVDKDHGTTLVGYQSGSFFEGGVNLTQLFTRLGQTAPCISKFFAETRSSGSFGAISATLSDFTKPVNFNICGSLAIAKTCDTAGARVTTGGDKISYHWYGTVTNSGFGPVYDVKVHDSLQSNTTDRLNVFACDANNHPTTTQVTSLLNHNDKACWQFTYETTAGSVDNSATAWGALTSGGTQRSFDTSSPSNCSLTVNNSVGLSKLCGPSDTNPAAVTLVNDGGTLKVRVDFHGSIQNTGDSNLTNITLADTPSATITCANCSGPVAPGGSINFTGFYVASGTDFTGDGTGAGRYTFNDTIKITGVTKALGNPVPDCTGSTACTTGVKAVSSASCPICPPYGSCSFTAP